MRRLGLSSAAGLTLVLSGCVMVPAAKVKTSSALQPGRLAGVSRIAVVPFFQASALGTDDPGYKGRFADMLPTVNAYEALSASSKKAFVPMQEVLAALRAQGFEGLPLAEGEQLSLTKAITRPDLFRAGMTMQQAMAAAKAVRADAVLFGSYGMVGNAPANMRVVMSMRLVETATGDVLWGGARAEKMNVSLLHPMESQKKQMRELAAKLFAEVP